jgi:hypothetical protein
VYDATPATPAPGPTFGAETLCIDVLFTRFNNLKGAGVVALLNEGVGKNGLALVVSDAGNTDLLRLATVDGDPTKKGKLKFLSSVPLKNGIAENVWYRLIMTVDPATPRVTGQVFTHSVPLDPDSSLAVQVGSTLTYEPTPAVLPTGVSSPGQNGILAQAVSAVVDLSVTNFRNDPATCGLPCISVHEDCDPNSAVNATFCGAGPHAVVTPAGRDPISYVKFLSPGIQSVTLTHCIDASTLSGQTLDIFGDTNLCDLEGGDAGNPRWNDSVCFVEINF